MTTTYNIYKIDTRSTQNYFTVSATPYLTCSSSFPCFRLASYFSVSRFPGLICGLYTTGALHRYRKVLCIYLSISPVPRASLPKRQEMCTRGYITAVLNLLFSKNWRAQKGGKRDLGVTFLGVMYCAVQQYTTTHKSSLVIASQTHKRTHKM